MLKKPTLVEYFHERLRVAFRGFRDRDGSIPAGRHFYISRDDVRLDADFPPAHIVVADVPNPENKQVHIYVLTYWGVLAFPGGQEVLRYVVSGVMHDEETGDA